jgi:copper(I)-binding protein
MKPKFLLPAGVAIALTLVAAFYYMRSAETAPPEIVVTDAWARASPPGAKVGAIFVTVENQGGTELRLVGATSPAAKSVMVHETVEENGVSTMRHAEPVIAPGETLEMRPGAVHVMLMGLHAPLKEGDIVDVTLDFEKAGLVKAAAKVGPMGAEGPME